MRKARPQNPATYALPNSKVPFLAPDVISKVIPSPVDGWDAISPLAEMDPKRAPILINWVPRPGYCELRGGYYVANTIQSGDPVETLMVFRTPTQEQMFAACGGTIYNASASGGGFLPSVVTGLSSDRWQYVNFTDQAGTAVLQCVNGADELLQYDGTSWTNPVITGLPGGTTAGIINIALTQQRLWYIMAGTTIAAYMPVGAITGAIGGTIDVGLLWRHGGYLVTVIAWTIDGGNGPQAYTAFISSRGEIGLFAGDDPANASTWSLVGIFFTSPPLSYRCAQQVGSDVGIITLQGVLPISQVLPFDPSADRSVALTARIQNAMAQAAAQAQNNFGWQLITFPAQQLVILNVPLIENISQVQFVMNALTGAWCQFNGWNANCFEIYQEKLYWGGNNGTVNQGYIGSSDFASPIAADMQCAFNWLDEPGRLKRMTMIQPLLNIGASIVPTLAVDTDFMTSSFVAPVTTYQAGVLWDVAKWDVSMWSTQQVNYINWLSVEAIGHVMAVRMRVNIATAGVGDTTPGEYDVGYFDTAEYDESSGAFSATLPVLQVNAFNTIAELGGAI